MRPDPHSCYDSDQPQVRQVTWKARIDFLSNIIEADAQLTFKEPGVGPLDLDTRDLAVCSVTAHDGTPLDHQFFAPDPIQGSRMRIMLPPGTSSVSISYHTSPRASALQWLSPAQTSGGRLPFLYSQCQQIHARSVIPMQDTPRIRTSVYAEIVVPSEFTALFSAGLVSREQRGGETTFAYEMQQSIPSYLFGLAVGALESRDLSARCRVWAEPEFVQQAADEFAGIEAMMTKAETLFGPYEWDRFDLLVMPPSFPYGGRENARLVFVSPTVLAGDRSLDSLVAHELAHSWTGNLVSSADVNHFWLNEGFAVYAERRILESSYGLEVAELQAALGRQRLQHAIEKLSDTPMITRLRNDLVGVDPDDTVSEVPYEKGYLLVRALDEAVGRQAFDAFLLKYVAAFRFRSITTEELIEFTNKELPGILERVQAHTYLDQPGIPPHAPMPHSQSLAALQTLGNSIPTDQQASSMSHTEWALYLDGLPHPSPATVCAQLEEQFSLSKSRNYEVLMAWLVLAISSSYEPAITQVESALSKIGRIKYLEMLYTALLRNPKYRAFAEIQFAKCRVMYHPIARQCVENVFKRCSPPATVAASPPSG